MIYNRCRHAQRVGRPSPTSTYSLAAPRPDPEPGRDGQGIRRPRARHAERWCRRERRGSRPGPAQQAAAENMLTGAPGRCSLAELSDLGQPELPTAPGRAVRRREQDRGGARFFNNRCRSTTPASSNSRGAVRRRAGLQPADLSSMSAGTRRGREGAAGEVLAGGNRRSGSWLPPTASTPTSSRTSGARSRCCSAVLPGLLDGVRRRSAGGRHHPEAPLDWLLRKACSICSGLAIATLATAAWIAIAYFFNQSLIDAVTGGEEVTRKEQPRLYNILKTSASRGHHHAEAQGD